MVAAPQPHLSLCWSWKAEKQAWARLAARSRTGSLSARESAAFRPGCWKMDSISNVEKNALSS